MLPVFVRNPGEEPQSILPNELRALDPAAELAMAPDGPFLPASRALREDAELREEIARGLLPRLVQRAAPVKLALGLGVLALLALVEVDRELYALEGPSAALRALVGLAVAALLARDFLRPLPRHPVPSALVLFGACARLLALATVRCKLAPAGVALPLVTALAGAAALALPSPARVQREIARALGLDLTEARAGAPWPIVFGLLASLLLPLLMFLGSKARLGIWAQAAIFSAVALSAPLPELERARHRPSIVLRGFLRVLGLATLGHFLAQSVALAARCAGHDWRALVARAPMQFGPRPATRAEAALLVVMTIAIVPWAEERIYRGILQRALAARLGVTSAIALSALVFGLAHVGVYGSALWQAVLLGVAFGAAFAEGGLLVAVAVHALWNAYVLL